MASKSHHRDDNITETEIHVSSCGQNFQNDCNFVSFITPITCPSHVFAHVVKTFGVKFLRHWLMIGWKYTLKFTQSPHGRSGCNLKLVSFTLMPRIDFLSICCEIVLKWMPQDSDKSALGQVMTWCCQATSHYLNQCWQSPIWCQWVNPSRNMLMLTPQMHVL